MSELKHNPSSVNQAANESPAGSDLPAGQPVYTGTQFQQTAGFWGFLTTQFLGAFNDNYFKQMVLLTCLSQVNGKAGPDRQPLAMAAFAIPFVLLSGLGGYLSDRLSKQVVIVGCKVAEIGITLAGLLVLLIPGLSADAQLVLLISILALMGAHSAIFGPSKYGVLPELFPEPQLRPVNGAVQMTTFLAIIFGTACAGIAVDSISGQLWMGSIVAVAIAVVGTMSSLILPKTRVAVPDLPFRGENLFIPRSIWDLIRRQKGLLMALIIATVFWFLGGVTQMAVNTLGKSTFGLSATRTSLMVAGIGFGIAAGCIVAGFLGKGQSGQIWVRSGAWLLMLSLALIGLLATGLMGKPSSAGAPDASIFASLGADGFEWVLRLSMVLLGVSAGMFVVPVQVYLQQAPPADLKGRVIGVQNFMTWIGILLSAAYVAVVGMIQVQIGGKGAEGPLQWIMFASLAVFMLPICLFYRLPGEPAE